MSDLCKISECEFYSSYLGFCSQHYINHCHHEGIPCEIDNGRRLYIHKTSLNHLIDNICIDSEKFSQIISLCEKQNVPYDELAKLLLRICNGKGIKYSQIMQLYSVLKFDDSDSLWKYGHVLFGLVIDTWNIPEIHGNVILSIGYCYYGQNSRFPYIDEILEMQKWRFPMNYTWLEWKQFESEVCGYIR